MAHWNIYVVVSWFLHENETILFAENATNVRKKKWNYTQERADGVNMLYRIHQIGKRRVGRRTPHHNNLQEKKESYIIFFIFFSYFYSKDRFFRFMLHTHASWIHLCVLAWQCSCATIINSFGKFTLAKRWFRTYIDIPGWHVSRREPEQARKMKKIIPATH